MSESEDNKSAEQGESEYRKLFDDLVHFAAKPVNSNAEIMGIRLGGRSHVNLPYIAVSTCGANELLMDRLNHKNSKIFNRYHAVVTHDAEKIAKKKMDAHEIGIVRSFLSKQRVDMANIESVFVGDSETIDCHLKQVILPDDDGNDFCLVPLHSTGLSSLLIAMAGQFNADRKCKKTEQDEGRLASNVTLPHKIRFAHMSYGGANPANITGIIGGLRKPLITRLPTENINYKRASSLYYRGIRYPSSSRVDRYLDWADSVLNSNRRFNRSAKDTEINLLALLVNDALHKGREALAFVNQYADKLGITPDEWVKDHLDEIQQGLISPVYQTKEWRKAFGLEVAHLIVNRKRTRCIDGRWQEVGTVLTSYDQARIASIIEKEVLK